MSNYEQQDLFQTPKESTSLPAPTLVSRFPLQARKGAKKIQDTSGQILLELSTSANPLGLLEKTLVDILDKVSTPYQRTWSVVVTDGGVLVSKHRVSARITEDKESGGSQKMWPTEKNMWSTPTAFDSTNIKGDRKKASGGQIPPLQQQVKMWPSPRVSDTEGGLVKNVELENGTFSRKNKKGVKWGVKLKDAVNHMEQVMMWPTPTTMDTKEDSLKHATKMLQGKTHRASGQPIQKTLSDKVMMEEILNNPELMELYQDHQMTERPYLPEQHEFVAYLRSQTTMKELAEKTDLKKTTIEHWFRKDKAGFSHPSVEDWEAIKPHLKELKYDKELTTIKSIEWENQKMWPTPAARDYKDTGENTDYEKLARKSKLSGAVKSKMYPTPRASEVAATITMDAALNRIEKAGYKANLEESVALKEQAKMFLTPGANEDAAGKPTGKMQRMLGNSPEVRGEGIGTLNPTWVEWLMGFPIGYTDSKPSETQ